MHSIFKKISIIAILTLARMLLFGTNANAQSKFSARLITITAHPFVKSNKLLHNNKIDSEGYLTFEPGILLAYNQYISPIIGAELSAAALKDRYGNVSAQLALMLKVNVLKYYKHSLSLGAGPGVFFEAGKMHLPEYSNEENFNTDHPTMYKISISGSIEYYYAMSKITSFSVSLAHPHPRSFAITAGVSFNIYDPDGKGCNCPSFR